MKTSPLRPHKVLEKISEGQSTHALVLTEGPFADIIFGYDTVKFEEDADNDKLVVKFEYTVYEVPKAKENYDKVLFEKELGDFLIELTYYGLERDHLGFIPADEQEQIVDVDEQD